MGDRTIFEMSDEELLNLDPATLFAEEESQAGASAGTGEESGAAASTDAGAGGAAAGSEEEEEEEGNTSSESDAAGATDNGEGEGSGTEAAGEAGKTGTENQPGESTPPAETPDKTPAAEPDYKAAYERIFAPIKANGKEIQLESVEDVIALMQMGANYNKKMAAIKPNLKVLKLLENNGLLDEAKLSFLIDLDKKNPEAIAKLVKDSGVDPLDMDEKAAQYRGTRYSVDDREVELDNVLRGLEGSPHLQQVMQVVGKDWDPKSKQVVFDNPGILEILNGHMSNGIYDLIAGTVERERMLGRLTGLSDLEAYRQVGDALHQQGKFAHLSAQGHQTPPVKKAAVAAPKTAPDQVREKKRAASPTKTTTSSGAKADFNPLALSDEEFAKLGQPNLM